MATEVPKLEETEAVILKAKGKAWLDAQRADFAQKYPTVRNEALAAWLIAKHNGLAVQEIQAAKNGGGGKEILIGEMHEAAKDPGAQGWTEVQAGGKFVQPATQSKYDITAVVLSMVPGTTTKGTPKMDVTLTDGTGIAKMVAYTDAMQLLAEAKVKRGTIIHLPLVNAQYGRHNFSKVKDKVWWKFSLPPFGDVEVVPGDPRDYFPNIDEEVPKADHPCRSEGFITSIEERLQDVCTVCDQWVLEKKMDRHEKCESDPDYAVTEKTLIEGSYTSITGEVRRVNFEVKPKVQMATELVEIFGKLTNNNAIDVAFVRKPAAPETEGAPAAPSAKPWAAKPTKKAPTPVAPPAEEAVDETGEEPAPASVPPKKPVKRPAPPPPEPEDDGQEEEEEAPDAAPSPPAPKKAKAASPPAAGGAVEVPQAIRDLIKAQCAQFSNKSRIFVVARAALATKKIPEMDEEPSKDLLRSYVEQMVSEGLVAWTDDQKSGFKWIGA